jgi:hypothetical protein
MRLRLGGVAFAAAVLIVVGAAPAEAHLVSINAAPTNYRTRILAVSPPIPGLLVRVAAVGGVLELRNRTGQQVTVLGVRSEPYLRVDADGPVDENRRSPTWLASPAPGESRRPRSTRGDLAAPPDWHRVSGRGRVVWHEHRAHWTGPDPPQVRQAPHHSQVVIPRWQVPLRVGGQTVVVTGEVVWVPGSSPWPWLVAAAVLAVGVGAGVRTRRWRLVVAAAVTVAVAADLVHLVGALLASVVPPLVMLIALTLSVVGWLLGGFAVERLWRRPDSESGVFLLLGSALFIGFTGSAGDAIGLGRSQVSTVLPVGVARAMVAASLGAAAGMLVAALLLARRLETSASPASAPG